MNIQIVYKWMICIVFGLFASKGFSQNAVIMLKFEDAEKAFNNGNFSESVRLLNEVEKEVGVSSKTLYLRIVCEDKLFENGKHLYDNIIEFDKLERLNNATKQYLEAMSSEGVDEKYRTVYEITKKLNEFPKTREDWKRGRDAYLKAEHDRQLAHEQALKEAFLRNKALEITALNRGLIQREQARYHSLSTRVENASLQVATVIVLRPEKDTRKMSQMLYLNDELLEKKLNPGEYAKYSFTPGLLKVGRTDVKNKRKVSKGASLLMGGVIGLAATSGKTIAESNHLLYINLEAGKTYYISSKILSNKKIQFVNLPEVTGKASIENLELVKD